MTDSIADQLSGFVSHQEAVFTQSFSEIVQQLSEIEGELRRPFVEADEITAVIEEAGEDLLNDAKQRIDDLPMPDIKSRVDAFLEMAADKVVELVAEALEDLGDEEHAQMLEHSAELLERKSAIVQLAKDMLDSVSESIRQLSAFVTGEDGALETAIKDELNITRISLEEKANQMFNDIRTLGDQFEQFCEDEVHALGDYLEESSNRELKEKLEEAGRQIVEAVQESVAQAVMEINIGMQVNMVLAPYLPPIKAAKEAVDLVKDIKDSF